MRKEQKSIRSHEYREIFTHYPLVFAMHFNNFVSNHISLDELRVQLQEGSIDSSIKPCIYLKVVKNTLVLKALHTHRYSCISNLFSGPTFLLYSSEASIAVCRRIVKLAADHAHIQFVGGKFENNFLSAEDLSQLVLLPLNKQELHLTNISSLMSNIHDLVGTLEHLAQDLNNVLQKHEKTTTIV